MGYWKEKQSFTLASHLQSYELPLSAQSVFAEVPCKWEGCPQYECDAEHGWCILGPEHVGHGICKQYSFSVADFFKSILTSLALTD